MSGNINAQSPPNNRFLRSKLIQARAHELIPGGCHTYAKGDDQYPVNAPGMISHGKGCRVWDVDGNEFIEYGMGLRAVTLGHGFAPVISAASRQMEMGSNFSRASPVEVECAEALLELVPGAEMVKFAKNGSDVTSAAVRLARAYTGRDMVAVCGDQPFFSTDDWFIGTTAMNAGIPLPTRDLTCRFAYDDLTSLTGVFSRHRGKIACVVLEAATTRDPSPGYLEGMREMCTQNGVLLIFDENITGFRWHIGGAQSYYGVTPDLSAFGKAMANGFAVAALVGKREIMDRGGISHVGKRVFLLSTTHGAECHALAACKETIRVYREEEVIERLQAKGERLKAGVKEVVASEEMQDFVDVIGHPANLIYTTKNAEMKNSQTFRTLFMQELIARGILGPSFVISVAHENSDIDKTIEAVANILPIYREALESGPDRLLIGRPVKPVFREYN